MTVAASEAGIGVASGPDWLRTLRRYIGFSAAAHLVWEFGHLPLYTIWLTGTAGEIAFAAAHCTGGDVLITLSTIVLALFLVGRPDWPQARARSVLLTAIGLGVGYTIFSEWLNIEIREAWAYREIMPVVPLIDTGLTPILQWILIPLAAWWWAASPAGENDRGRSRHA